MLPLGQLDDVALGIPAVEATQPPKLPGSRQVLRPAARGRARSAATVRLSTTNTGFIGVSSRICGGTVMTMPCAISWGIATTLTSPAAPARTAYPSSCSTTVSPSTPT